jgi:PEP-CTERM motif
MCQRAIGMKLLCSCVVASMAFVAGVQGQVRPTFSIDVQSATSGGPGAGAGIPDGWFGIPLDEGAIMTPMKPGPPGPNPPGFPALAPLPTPGLMVGPLSGAGGSVPGGLGLTALFDAVELDALSYGHDLGIELMFSVDEWAAGDFLAPPGPPNVFSEGPVSGANQAAADVFSYLGPVMRTPPPLPGTGLNNKLFIDGDGFNPFGVPGLGLLEPMPPGCGLPCNGDNLDALDINSRLVDVQGPIYFSLDSSYVDPVDGFPMNTGTAAANLFSGADILISRAGGFPTVYAQAAVLGLDLLGFDTDDLDALILIDDGDGQYDPAVDRILFSVRRGSAVIGSPDSMFGVPIEEGDVLSVPIPGAGPFPSLYIAAEALGLATVRSNTNELTPFGDELDALDLFLAGDLDGDGFVGIVDLNIVLSNWNKTIPPGDPSADVDGDGFVGINDLNVVLSNWNAGAPLPPGSSAAVPEPTTVLFLGIGGAALLGRRR